jgi:hypothetical protein
MTDRATIERFERELHRLFERVETDLGRIEILLAALDGFNRPVLDYKPRFAHLSLKPHEVGEPARSGRH